MPFRPPNTISDIDKSQRNQFKRLVFEQTVMSYAFSYERLHKMLAKLAPSLTPDAISAAIEGCVVAFEDKEVKKAKENIKDQVSAIYTENSIIQQYEEDGKTRINGVVRYQDPFGNTKDVSIYQGNSVSFDKDKAMQWGVSHGVPAAKFQELMTAGKKESTFIALVCRSVKHGEGDDT